jgi:hypothetical protein
MQEAGEPLKLRFTKGPFGPYAENLRHVLHQIDGYFVSGYGQGGDMPDKLLELVPGAVDDANRALAKKPETLARFERVAKLVEGFESPFGVELLATVHWLRAHEGVRDSDVVEATWAWGDRKRRFSRRQVLLAERMMTERGWLEATS